VTHVTGKLIMARHRKETGVTDTRTTNETVTDFLRRQHAEVRSMFAQMEGAQGETRTQIFDCLRAFLAVHETAEEEVIYPALRKSGGDAAAVVAARLKEEDQAKKTLSELEKLGPDGEGFGGLFAEFRSAVIDHAHSEETEVFPLLEHSQDADALRSMAQKLAKAEKMAPTHPHPHAPESGVGNMALGPFVAMVDKVRDALKH
jgi:hemerythrin superfamily protein